MTTQARQKIRGRPFAHTIAPLGWLVPIEARQNLCTPFCSVRIVPIAFNQLALKGSSLSKIVEVQALNACRQLVLTLIAASTFFIGACAASNAQQTPESSPSPAATESPSAPPAGPSEAPVPSPSASPESQFYQADGDIFEAYNINRDVTAYYYFQGNQSGSGKAKQEFRYGRNLWNLNSQLRIRVPFLTQYPLVGNPFAGLGNIEVGYNYNVVAPSFDHSLEFRGAFATSVSNAVQSRDTELKGFYNLKWKFPGWSVAYTNEYDQTIIKPPGASWASYYEGKLTLPEYAFKNVRGLKFSAIYNFRILFDTSGLYKSAVGGTLFGNIKNVALLIIDTWGIGGNGLWKYKFEANATAKF